MQHVSAYMAIVGHTVIIYLEEFTLYFFRVLYNCVLNEGHVD